MMGPVVSATRGRTASIQSNTAQRIEDWECIKLMQQRYLLLTPPPLQVLHFEKELELEVLLHIGIPLRRNRGHNIFLLHTTNTTTVLIIKPEVKEIIPYSLSLLYILFKCVIYYTIFIRTCAFTKGNVRGIYLLHVCKF